MTDLMTVCQQKQRNISLSEQSLPCRNQDTEYLSKAVSSLRDPSLDCNIDPVKRFFDCYNRKGFGAIVVLHYFTWIAKISVA